MEEEAEECGEPDEAGDDGYYLRIVVLVVGFH
jgi:hypothetical protein